MKNAFLVLLSLCSLGVLGNQKSEHRQADHAEISGAKSHKVSTSRSEDTKAILAVIDTYIEGLRTGRVDLLQKCFHKEAIMYGYSIENKITEGSVQHLYDIIEKFGALKNVTSTNSVLHQTSNTATVLAELKTTAPHENSTDYLSLMKINGEWKIISKVYHLSYTK